MRKAGFDAFIFAVFLEDAQTGPHKGLITFEKSS
jgi:hypothetical protein